MDGLLAGIRVVESAQLFNGDHLGMLLGDLGADVIKVESPDRGDYLRDFLGQVQPHWSPAHLHVNKNKRSVTLDLRRDEGRQAFWELLRTADVFVDGNADDALARLGVGYEDQRKVKPDIVYCQYTGFGATGPYAAIPTHGQMMNALAAGMPVAMGEDGLVHPVPGRPYMGGTVSGGEATAAGGVYAAYHVAAALVRRDRTGQGCCIDVSGAEAVLAASWIGATYNLNYERIDAFVGLSERREDDTGELTTAKYQFYETKDRGFLLFCCIEPKFWNAFCRAVGRDDLCDTTASGPPVDFAHDDEALRRQLQEIFHTRTQAEWVALAAEHDIALGPAHAIDDLRSDPQLAARGALVDVEHPVAGPFTHVTQPALVDGVRSTTVHRPAPALGEHTDEVLAELGYSASAIKALRADGIA